jgi:hypothetical protein
VGDHLSPATLLPEGINLYSHKIRGWAGSSVGLEEMEMRKIQVSGGTEHWTSTPSLSYYTELTRIVIKYGGRVRLFSFTVAHYVYYEGHKMQRPSHSLLGLNSEPR